MSADNTTKIGYINACIAGDFRYASRVEVLLEGTQAHVVLLENAAVAGMDGPGTSTPFAETRRKTVEAKPADIVKAIKAVMDETITRYGKPTKNFVWVGVKERGLSVARCKEALKIA